MRDYAEVKGDGHISTDIADRALDMLSVDQEGFDHLDRRLLLALLEKFDGGPVGVESLAAAISEERGTIEDVLEPYLIQQGYMVRTPRGRMATPQRLSALRPAGALRDGAGGRGGGTTCRWTWEGTINSVGEFSHKLRVYIEDTDAGGIVYYVNYLKYMERARTEFMRTLGYAKNHIFNLDLMFVVRDVAVSYRLPARLDDELEATARIKRLRAAGIVFRQTVRRGDEVLAEGDVTIACVDRADGKPRRLPAEMTARLEGMEKEET